MTIYYTHNLLLPYPDGNEDVSLGPTDFQDIVQLLDAGASGPVVTRVVTGPLSGLGAGSSYPLGTLYQCTDVSAIFLRDAATNWRFVQLDGGGLMIGASAEYYGTADPIDPDGVTRWIIQDGRALNRTTYATLFARIGTTWGAGDGSTTYNIPDTRGLLTRGAGQNGHVTTSAYSLGTYGGSEQVTLATANVPAHTHGYSGSGTTGVENQAHNHGYTGGIQAGFGYAGGGNTEYAYLTTGATTGTENQNHNHSFSWSGTTDTGSGSTSPFNILAPYAVANRIIRII